MGVNFFKKSKNANKKGKIIASDGKEFKSKLECDFYEYLKITYPHKNIILQPVFKLIPSFEFKGVKVRGMIYTADFMIDDIVYETKGNFKTESFRMREKLFKYFYGHLTYFLVTRKGGEWLFNAPPKPKKKEISPSKLEG